MKKILIIDDDEGILDYITQLLSDNYECLTANSFDEFLKLFAQRAYNLILTDLNLGNAKTAKCLKTCKG